MLKLLIGNKNYSSWSMRPWVLMKHFGLEFEEIMIPLYTDNYQEKIAAYSSNLLVPQLLAGDITIWDSLAICEYLNEQHLNDAALPSAVKDRALCRAYCAEMHSGFLKIRNQMPMNCRARRRIKFDPGLQAEIARVTDLWEQARAAHKSTGDYLFGDFSLADAFFAPMVMRFITYQVSLSTLAEEYAATITKNDAVRAWLAEAEKETESIPDFEKGDPVDSRF